MGLLVVFKLGGEFRVFFCVQLDDIVFVCNLFIFFTELKVKLFDQLLVLLT
jgi:hypothetical protein